MDTRIITMIMVMTMLTTGTHTGMGTMALIKIPATWARRVRSQTILA